VVRSGKQKSDLHPRVVSLVSAVLSRGDILIVSHFEPLSPLGSCVIGSYYPADPEGELFEKLPENKISTAQSA